MHVRAQKEMVLGNTTSGNTNNLEVLKFESAVVDVV